MIPSKYNFKQQYAGDTFNGVVIDILDISMLPINITGYTFRMQIKSGEKGRILKNLSINNGITILDNLIGKIKIDSFIVPNFCGNAIYDLEVVYPNGHVDTYIRGLFPIINDITR